MTYAELNLLFVIPVAALLFFFRYLVRWRKLCWTVSALVLMTAIFDNFIVGSGIVAYNIYYRCINFIFNLQVLFLEIYHLNIP